MAVRAKIMVVMNSFQVQLKGELPSTTRTNEVRFGFTSPKKKTFLKSCPFDPHLETCQKAKGKA